MLAGLETLRVQLGDDWYARLDDLRQELQDAAADAYQAVGRRLEGERMAVAAQRQLVAALNPALALARGFAIVRGADGRAVRHAGQVRPGGIVSIGIMDAELTAEIKTVDPETVKGERI